jgi:hypothetical protein
MTYIPTVRTIELAAKLGVIVRSSTSKGKKLDVLKDDTKICSIGAIGYADYPTYLLNEQRGIVPKGTAKSRQKAYKIRHKSDRMKKGSAGWYADQLLWS